MNEVLRLAPARNIVKGACLLALESAFVEVCVYPRRRFMENTEPWTTVGFWLNAARAVVVDAGPSVLSCTCDEVHPVQVCFLFFIFALRGFQLFRRIWDSTVGGPYTAGIAVTRHPTKLGAYGCCRGAGQERRG